MPKAQHVKTISICLPIDMVEELKRRAWVAGVSLSSYIAVALSDREELRKIEHYYDDTDSIKIKEV